MKNSKLLLYFQLSFFILIFTFSICKAGVISDAPGIPELLLRFLNFFLQIFGAVAIIAMVASGITYLTAGGNESRIRVAKRWTVFSIIGIAIALIGVIIIKQIFSLYSN